MRLAFVLFLRLIIELFGVIVNAGNLDFVHQDPLAMQVCGPIDAELVSVLLHRDSNTRPDSKFGILHQLKSPEVTAQSGLRSFVTLEGPFLSRIESFVVEYLVSCMTRTATVPTALQHMTAPSDADR